MATENWDFILCMFNLLLQCLLLKHILCTFDVSILYRIFIGTVKFICHGKLHAMEMRVIEQLYEVSPEKIVAAFGVCSPVTIVPTAVNWDDLIQLHRCHMCVVRAGLGYSQVT